MRVERYRYSKFLLLIAILLGISASVASAQEPFRDLGRPHNFAAEDAKPQSVWLPYWSERDHHHATLHVRNVMLHTPIDITVELFAAAGSRAGGGSL
ncbi:MAG: hypothetical protein MUF01_11330 [Bryobacterales bacterium]|nr:hypothetical protein [Bryobacterales bacterium]